MDSCERATARTGASSRSSRAFRNSRLATFAFRDPSKAATRRADKDHEINGLISSLFAPHNARPALTERG